MAVGDGAESAGLVDAVLSWLSAAWLNQGFTIFGLVVAAIVIATGGRIWRNIAKSRGSQTTATEAVKGSAGRPITVPAPNPNYTGRAEKLDQLADALRSGHAASIIGIEGMGCVGKTGTAQVVAHRLLGEGRFADGAVMIDLQGFSESGAGPLPARDALNALLSQLGETARALPDDPAQAEAALRALWLKATSGKDILVILDNARDGDQARPLLPGEGASVLVTSRNPVDLPGVEQVRIDRLGETDARVLMDVLVPDLGGADVKTWLEVADGLPLLIEVMEYPLRHRAGRSAASVLADYAALDGGGDRLAQVQARLALSVDALGPEEAARWAGLSQFEGGFHAQSAATMWGVERATAEALLEIFHHRSLIIPVDSPFAEDHGARWRLHDHLRAVGRARLAADPDAKPLRDGWLRAALEMMGIAGDQYDSHGDGIAAGLALLDQELATIRAAAEVAGASAAVDDAAADVAMRLPNFGGLDLRLALSERIRWLEAGLPGARRRGEKTAEAALLGNLGHRLRLSGDLERAEETLLKSLTLNEEMGLKQGISASYGNLGLLYHTRGELGRSEEMYLKGLAIDIEMGRKEGIAVKYGNLGILHCARGELDRAGEMLLKALKLDEEMGRKEGMAENSLNIAALRFDQYRPAEALQLAERARALFSEMGAKQGIERVDMLIATINARL
ncbi:tetratricopeptide repeat protein [Pikeienuella piscinae]|uniref:Tetratricopeptide repeat protein n=1 Tax=Pikeienuella piscinae TaxID=2748098 RepID=A0A7L5BX45_9RHOB|nr:tetratricopeptide repeat protein [Pikeienuella piscinae]QIE55723.1 tetratricopeptide repeat protein [Pikeienuella piscinae]